MKQEQEPPREEIDEVSPGILRLQLPVPPTMGLGHVNCYAIEDARGVAVVDPGLPGPEPWAELERRLGQAGFPLARVHTVVVTHSHPDHFGGARFLQRSSGADLITHAFFKNWFVPEDVTTGLDAEGQAVIEKPVPWKSEPHHLLVPPEGREDWQMPVPTHRVEDADPVRLGRREWIAVHTPGHTPDHLCLLDPASGVFLSGDHVLPSITPHISGMLPGIDPLARFLDSLDRVRALDGVEQVLPAHGHPFSDLVGRIDAIRRHHTDRLEVLRQAAVALGPATVEDLSHELFAERAWGGMAESETYAHLEHLRQGGEVISELDEGMLHYRVAG